MLGRYPLGVMQGRLLPKYRGRYQAHPVGTWADEFAVAAAQGLELIEFILDFNDAEANPLLADPAAIARAGRRTGLGVRSVCADYFMEAPLQRVGQSVAVLDRLLDSAGTLGIRDVVIPCVDQSSLQGEEDAAAFVATIRQAIPKALALGVNLSLETDLAPRPFAQLLERIASPVVTVNYDTGNSAALGFDPAEEFAAYGDRISDIHIKDRVRGGGSVILGQGDCDFATVFRLIARSGYDGPLIMQVYRDDEGVAVFRQQLAWLTENYGAILSGEQA